ncbi:hypothetical protein FACS1894200_00150 [Spirochaetia bacterium]|nr:hypothetical protein FACS1894200_00150 [Spirochaetia bacterium]
MGIKTFVDSCVFINLFSPKEHIRQRAFDVVKDKSREIIISDYVKLEVRPKMFYNGYWDQLSFVDESSKTLNVSNRAKRF